MFKKNKEQIMFKDTPGCVELQWFHDAWEGKNKMLTKVAWVKIKHTNFHAYISWIYQQNSHHDPYTFSTFSLHHSKLSIQMYLILLINHNTTTSALYSCLKTTKTQRGWFSLPPHGNKLQTCPEVWTSTLNLLSFVFEKSHHTMKVHSPSLSYILKLLSSYIPQCIGTFLHKFLQKKLSHLMCFCSYQIYNSSCLPARFFSFSLVSAVIFDAESFAPAYCAWACLLLAS